jgi:hypothetical protein
MWAIGLKKSGILNLLEVPHFGRSLEINGCVKLLPSCVHGRTLWLDPPVSIDIALIARITRLPKVGDNPDTSFNKEGERALSEAMKEKLHTFRREKGLDVTNINYDDVQFETQVLAYKLLCKCRKDKVLARVITVAEKYSEGVQMN